jgi:hypothetical protein
MDNINCICQECWGDAVWVSESLSIINGCVVYRECESCRGYGIVELKPIKGTQHLANRLTKFYPRHKR